MTMESVLKKLESRIEEFVGAYGATTARVSELEAKVKDMERQLADSSELVEKIASLEAQRDELGQRLEKVLGRIDDALADAADGSKA
jgi:chromosome segregation ATPase